MRAKSLLPIVLLASLGNNEACPLPPKIPLPTAEMHLGAAGGPIFGIAEISRTSGTYLYLKPDNSTSLNGVRGWNIVVVAKGLKPNFTYKATFFSSPETELFFNTDSSGRAISPPLFFPQYHDQLKCEINPWAALN